MYVHIDTIHQIGGRGGIRTHGTVSRSLDFESSALNRAQPPFREVIIELGAFWSKLYLEKVLIIGGAISRPKPVVSVLLRAGD